MVSGKIQQWLLQLSWVLSAVLLIRFAIDFWVRMRWWLSLPFVVLVVGALCVAFSSIFPINKRGPSRPEAGGEPDPRSVGRMLVLAAIPITFLTSSFDCSGLSLSGCSPFCTFVKVYWIPGIAILCGLYFVLSSSTILTAIILSSFVTLFPHCICYNVGNGWWIDRLGASPLCYGWAFLVSVLVAGTLRSGRNLSLTLVLCGAIVAGSSGFFVAHHYFRFPW